ncbi:MAG: hypothetical protein ACM33V_08810 [Chloroflexota bacterium]|nr:hypothetical protein [Anaerolineales bacterium]
MEIFGVGPAELFFVFLLAIIILGPKDMQKAGRTIGRFLNQLIRSDSWKVFQKTSAEIRNLPRNLMRDANLEEINKELQDTSTKLQEAGKEIEQKIDARPQPPATGSAVPVAPIPPATNEDKPEPSASDQVDPSAGESTVDDMDKNG